jgi:hypothetical protein
MASSRRPGGVLRGLLKVFLGGLLLLATMLCGAYAAAWWRLRSAERAWTRDFEPTAAVLARHPPAATNETARRLDDLVRPLGIVMTGAPSRNADLSAILTLVSKEEISMEDDPAPLPPPVQEFLATHADQLASVEMLLLNSAPLVWPSDHRLGYAAPGPPLMALRQLNAVLLARARDRDRTAQPADVGKSIEASFRASDGLHDRPELVSQLIAGAMVRARSATMRHLTHSLPEWPQRRGAHDFRRSFAVAYQMEAHLQTGYGRGLVSVQDLALNAGEPRPGGAWNTTVRLISTPYTRLSAADYSQRLRGMALEFRAVDPCRSDVAAVNARLTREIPRWNVLGRLALRSLPPTWTTVADVELNEELTGLVMQARSQPVPPTADAQASRVCKGLQWTRTPDGSGGLVIEARDASLPERTGGAPWRYHLRASSATAVAQPPRDR